MQMCIERGIQCTVREGTYAIGLWHCSTLWELAMAHDPLLHAHTTAPEAPVRANAALDLWRIKAELVVGGGTRIGGGRRGVIGEGAGEMAGIGEAC